MNEKQINTAREVINRLHDALKFDLSLSKENSEKLFGNNSYSSFEPIDSDYIVSIGGDACVLRSARTAIEFNKPLIGINSGRLGYLCCLSLDEVDNLTEDKINKFKQTKRTLLDVNVNNKNYFAVNDLIVGKSNFGKAIKVSATLNNEENSFYGDGIIVSTPTGSTAYNQSAGGPTIKYDEPKFVVTPICPHLSKFKSVIINDNELIIIKANKAPENAPYLYCDGAKIAEIDGEIIIKKHNKEFILCVK